MSFLRYNGVVMSLVQTRRYMQEPIKLAQDISGTRHTATVLATIEVNTLRRVGGAQAEFAQGVQAWLALRDLLMAPRKPFLYAVGDRTIVNFTIPAPPDIELGPKPLAATCVGFNGTGSMLVEYTIQWSMANPCKDREYVQAVLAQGWMSSDELDQDFFLTRIYHGRIHFDPRVAGPGGSPADPAVHPDTFRHLLLPPRTPGMYRVQMRTRLLEDGYTLDWECTDKQPAAFVNSTVVSRMVAKQTVHHTVPGPREEALAQSARASAAAAIATSTQETIPVVNEKGRLIVDAGAPFRIAAAIKQAAAAQYDGIPIAVHTVTATAFGVPEARFSELARAARVVCLFRLMRATQVGTIVPALAIPLPFPAGFNVNFDPSLPFTPYGGECSQEDSADPKASTCTILWKCRPRSLRDSGYLPPAAIENRPQWEAGDNTMPTIEGNQLIDRAIKNEQGQLIPAGIAQLVYGGTFGATSDSWGWYASGWTFGLMSDKDVGNARARVRVYGRNAIPDGTTGAGFLELAFIKALQDPCVSVPFTQTAAVVSTKIASVLP